MRKMFSNTKMITTGFNGFTYVLLIAFVSCFWISCDSKDEDEVKIGSLNNRSIKSALHSGGMVLLKWSGVPIGCIGSEVKYTNAWGEAEIVIVPAYQTATQLLNYNESGDPFQYRTMFLLNDKANDTLYSKYQSVSNITKGEYELPEETSKYNRGGSQFAGRYKDETGGIKYFELAEEHISLYDGGGRVIGTVTKPVKINMGTEKEMQIQGETETYVWAWDTNAGLSGWVARTALMNPPDLLGDGDPFALTNPSPAQESTEVLKINATAGTDKLSGLVHRNSRGEIPTTGGNQGIHYAGRNPGPLNYVYLSRAVPNVQKGGTSKDSMPDGSLFVPAMDKYGKIITEVMTMYENADVNKPVKVTFIYGRPQDGKAYGWLARANVGNL